MNKSDLEKMQKCREEYEKFLKESPLHSEMEKIAKDIRDRQDNVMAMEFTRTIAELLRENGIVVHCTENSCIRDVSDKKIEKVYGVMFDSVDCTEHDKKFTDRIAELEKYLDRKQTEINQIDEILNNIFGVTHDVVKTPDEFKEILKEKADNYKTVSDVIPEEPIKVAEMLINAEGEYKDEALEMFGGVGKEKYKIFDIFDLKQIAEHFLVYCNHNSEDSEK